MHGGSAIDTTNNPVHVHGFFTHGDFRHHGCIASKREIQRASAAASHWKRLSPSRFYSGQFQRGEMSWRVAQQFPAELVGIGVGGYSQFIQETLISKCCLRSVDRPPPSQRN